MCLLAIAVGLHPRFDLVVAANRDERHDRASTALEHWSGEAHIVAGRDLQAGGTWLGVTRAGRFAAVTNFRDGAGAPPDAPSRGDLVAGFLRADEPASTFAAALVARAARYAGFNLVLADRQEAWFVSNRAAGAGGGARLLSPGLHALSNGALDEPIAKVLRSRKRLGAWLDRGSSDLEELFGLLEDRDIEVAAPAQRRRSSAPFIVDSVYGTRNSTVVARERAGGPQRESAPGLQAFERRFGAGGIPAGETRLALTMTPDSL